MATSIVFDIIGRDKASRAFSSAGGSASKFGAILKRTAVGAGVLTAATGAFIFKTGAGYVNTLNKVQAVTGASNKQMDAAAKFIESNAGLYAKMGQTSGDAATGVVELAKSGLSLHASLKAVYGTMVLAKAGELDVADASAVVSNALNVFHLKASKAGDVANYLANAANISSADVSDLTESLKYVSPVAAKSGVSIQQVNAILAELANAGIKGTQAGTSLRTFLLNLQAPSGAAKKALDDLNVSIFDTQGKMKPLPQLIGELGSKLGGLTQKERQADLKAIFGKTGIAGATQILSEGTKGLDKYTKGVVKSGAAQKLAEARSKGLAGSFQIVIAGAKSGAQSIYRQFSPIADKVIRPLATKFANFAGNLGPNLAKGTDKIKGVLDKLNISGVGKNLAKQAQDWAKPVIAGFRDGLNTGDWSGLGKALGSGIVKALGAVGDIAGKFADAFKNVDWVGLGLQAGKMALPFAIGLVAGIINGVTDPQVWKGVARHWSDILFAALAVAFTPSKFAEPVIGWIAKVPFVGKFLGASLGWLNKIGNKLLGAFGRLFKEQIGKEIEKDATGLVARFVRGFQGITGRTGHLMGLLTTRLGVWAIDAFETIPKGLAKAAVAADRLAGRLPGMILRAIGRLADLLFPGGRDLIGGLIRGWTSRLSNLLGSVKSLSGRILAAVRNFGSLLYNAGASLIQGLIDGIGSKIGAVGSKMSSIANKIKGFLPGSPVKEGPLRSWNDGGAGKRLMDLLVQGIGKGFVPLTAVMTKLTGYIQKQGQKLNSLLSAKADFASGFQSFTTSVFDTDLSHTTTDANGNDHTTPATIADMLKYQTQQRHKARQLRADVARLHKLGLSNALIKQLQASGESGEAQIHTLAGGSRSQIRRLNALNKQTEHALQRAGNIAGGQLYNTQIAQARNNRQLARMIAEELHRAERRADAGKGEELVIKDVNGQWIIRAVKKEQRTRGQKSNI